MESSTERLSQPRDQSEVIRDPEKGPQSLRDILKSLEDEDASKEHNTESEKKSLIKKLYEGPAKCPCCKNWVEEYPEDIKKAVEGEWKDAALLLRYAKSHAELGQEPLELYSMTVQNEKLKEVVKLVLDKYPGVDTNVRSLTFTAPFEPFFHRWSRLEERRQTCQAEDEAALIDILYTTLKAELSEGIEQAAELSTNGNITFKLLFALYPPGSVTFCKGSGQETCSIVSGTQYREVQGVGEVFFVGLWSLDQDESGHGWSKRVEQIVNFNGIKRISELAVVPKDHVIDAAEIFKRLALRGRRALEVVHKGYQSYNGLITIDGLWGPFEQYVDGRIMVDPLQYSRNKPGSVAKTSPYPLGLRILVPDGEQCLIGSDEGTGQTYATQHSFDAFDGSYIAPVEYEYPGRRYDPHGGLNSAGVESGKPSKVGDDPLSDHRWTKQVLDVEPESFCPPFVRGYCLQSKVWAEFQINNISDIIWNDKAFDSLVIPQARKRLLRAMVEQQKRHKTELDDVVRGKGQGLILLLAGPPGTGKTLTAESIADRLRMPLYAMNASQLGERSADLEEDLGKVLRLAAAWNAVLLLDEADAFLEKRGDGQDSLEKNKRVAAFLRVLEYYKGVLILTTNRALDFDEAFYSRIHLSLKYLDLDAAARRAIWSNFLLPVTELITEADIESLANQNMNGRQIKNVVKMARLLAEGEHTKLNTEHVRDVLSIIREDGL